ncbi:MATE family efflux transporter [Priestia taiwanensis]|uniref:Multidrug export protein MepA n=1 Tax=Priestia taiwanensis TaxID=1347902 RepID=A0A917AX60_9BACI|nr:MATE family efflux transporter [Priestia taiwanensis]MBM7364698.1 putative MATE family efflux protein [Priestia taiwanensis]GGE78954.1 MATE family efflux transporter [Priestia taiwanensis]
MTEATIKLRETPVKKLFLSYLIPSVLGMLLMSVNIIVDGIFVSHGVGPEGLAGINIAVPVFAMFFSISLWFGVGGGTLYSIALGQNDIRKAQTIFTQAFVFAIAIVATIATISVWNEEKLAYLFGANETILPYVLDYLHVILVFGIVYVLENMLSIFIRNDGNPRLAMMGLVTTSVLNIILNYIFIFILELGVRGAALATVLSAGIGFLVLLTHFLRKSSTLRFVRIRFEWRTLRDILNMGFPSFIVESSAAIITMGYNIVFMRVVGEIGVTAFAVVNYLHAMILMIFFGVGAALQPIASFHYGAKLFERLKASLRLTVQTGLLFGIVAVCIGFFFADALVAVFGIQSEEVINFTIQGIGLFFISYMFLGYNLVYGEYFQAIGNIRKSLVIIVCRSFVFLIPLLWILPKVFGVTGIWLALPVAEACTACVVYMMNKRRAPVPTAAAA